MTLWRSIFLVLLLQPGLLIWGGPCLASAIPAHPAAAHADSGCCAAVKTCAVEDSCCPVPTEQRPTCPFCTCGEKLPFGPYIPIDDLILIGSDRPAAPAAISNASAYASRIDVAAHQRWVERPAVSPAHSTRRAMLCIWLN
ncbi:MAG: hypothetical protein EA376_08905 [Phycisphaeraceae bacterium]|nr:MAG: hypothetical protein EA376_08905 [Phycisphaeraceae bacterium]